MHELFKRTPTKSAHEPLVFPRRHRSDDAQISGRHSHALGQLAVAAKGVMTIATDAGRWAIPAPFSLWIPPKSGHHLVSHGAFEAWSIYVSEIACNGLPEMPKMLRLSGLLMEAAVRISTWTDGPQSLSQHRISQVLVDELSQVPFETLRLPMPVDHRLAGLVEKVIQDIGRNRPFDEWASLTGMSSRTLSRRFLQETGLSFSEWQRRARLTTAAGMLVQRIPVTTVALDVGYENLSAFIAAFSRYHGTSPTRYAATHAASS